MSWELVRWLHLLAMAFVVGGQLVLVAAVCPPSAPPITARGCGRSH